MSDTAPTSTAVAKPKGKKKKHIFRRIFLILLALLLIAALGLYVISKMQPQYTTSYVGYTASIGSISNALSFSGSLALIDSKTYTADSAATVRQINVAAGDDVSEGDQLMRLSNGSIIKADFDSRVNTLNVEQGDSVAEGESLLQLADFSHMKVSIRVDEYDIGSIHVGQACRVTATATERVFNSEIAAIDYISASSGNVAYYTATAFVDVGAQDGVYPGMQVTVTVPQEEANDVVVLNMNALSFDENNNAFVYMEDESGEMTRVPVETGVSNGSYVEIRSGLAGGDRVYAPSQSGSAGGFAFGNMPGGGFGGGEGSFDFDDLPEGEFPWDEGSFDFDDLPEGGFPSGDFSGGFPGGNMPGGGFGGGTTDGGGRP